MAFNWNEENTSKLEALWKEGVPARKIGEILGGITKNAVIGKANRLNLSRSKSENKKEKIKKKNNSKQQLSDITNPTDLNASRYLCQWPFGHPGEKDFHFCCKPVMSGRPYCEEHIKIAYRKIK